jgi:hypothetical protein
VIVPLRPGLAVTVKEAFPVPDVGETMIFCRFDEAVQAGGEGSFVKLKVATCGDVMTDPLKPKFSLPGVSDMN